ncbi:hypothetical protein ASPZODRAFT_129551 [Penicilliopsis zonata CBS 506.65]|uniref:Nucleic acid-binding protein n=1 Tax=Penicilliopsis zonata CBS 506.65 TaxID=1073090 RepID=A0A1L9SPZ3_9EURO|nr:hypothetical protein ASPZODRAFT_129551 [Penicilliopsis zonata CBS 506.65]OJJ49144.1 hypothetical protein ASPZODRAFT_129551 [Penicilliopsis zonata CBS 506.65]
MAASLSRTMLPLRPLHAARSVAPVIRRAASTTQQNTEATTTTSTTAHASPAPPSSTDASSPPPPFIRSFPSTLKTGTVISAGLMDRTVRVAHRHTTWDSHIRKLYPKVTKYMVSDPRNSLREGDVIEFSSGFPKSRHVRHVVERIIAPFGESLESRPPLMTKEERDAVRVEKRAAKLDRREARAADGGKRTTQRRDEYIGRVRRLVQERMSRTQ